MKAPPHASPPLSRQRLKLWLKLLDASSFIEDELRSRFRTRFNSTLPRFDVLAVLSRSDDGMKMGEISGRLRVSGGNVTGIVDKLVEEGLVARRAVEGDRRALRVALTNKGRAVFAEQAASHEIWIDEILAALNEDDIEGMIRRLDHLSGAVNLNG